MVDIGNIVSVYAEEYKKIPHLLDLVFVLNCGCKHRIAFRKEFEEKLSDLYTNYHLLKIDCTKCQMSDILRKRAAL